MATALFEENRTTAYLKAVVKKAIRTRQNLELQSFLTDARRISNQMIRAKYKVVFPIHDCGEIIVGKRKSRGVWINFDPTSNSQFMQSVRRNRQSQVGSNNFDHGANLQEYRDLPLAVVSVDAANASDAFEQAEAAISTDLGLVSLFLYRGRSIIPENPRTPIARCIIAPHMTVHSPSGALSSQQYWFNHWPQEVRRAGIPADRVTKLLRIVVQYRENLSKLPWKQTAEIALAQHYEAFSKPDGEAAFLGGWRVLETIGGPNFTKSDRLVSRAASFFRDTDYHRDLGRHLQFRRNSVAHGKPIAANDDETVAFQMREFIAPFMWHFISNPFQFRSLDELWSFCDADTERKDRVRKVHILKSAAKFRNESEYP
ncbi:hypothetical protein [Sulfitobacter geojensis]|uniref:hypothetical protein n=1 Tax=Sulfitobacter geojensis TaxID=1342299 RepID=UPI0012DE4913|nr:hypothetical protein [Sulfitobacter geojensis]NYI28360.1 hypothetical protein [Sulfitobacter geojensis]